MRTSAVVAGLVALAVTVVVGGVGTWGMAFGVMTECTNNYNCTTTQCVPPCDTAEAWFTAGLLAQGVLFVATLVLLALIPRGRRLSIVLALALAIPPVSIATVVGTTWAAQQSFCQPGDDTPMVGGGSNYCDT